MVIDYERAWAELSQFLADDPHPQIGKRNLLAEMTRITARCRVNETSLPHALRVFGVEVAAGRVRPDIRDVDPSLSGSAARPEMDSDHGHRAHDDDRGGHDGRIHAAEAIRH